MEIKEQKDYRKDFPLLNNNSSIYIDNAATAQKPQCVIDAESRFYEVNNANPLRGFYPLSLAATKEYEDAREVVRQFLNADSDKEIIFTRNTTESLNLVAYSYGINNLKAGVNSSFNNGTPQQSSAMADGCKSDRCNFKISGM